LWVLNFLYINNPEGDGGFLSLKSLIGFDSTFRRMPRVCVVIPTYNEAETIGELLERLESLGLDLHIVIVDDGSTDGTIELVEEASRRYGNLTLVERGVKLGLGSAIRDGLKEALGQGAELVVTMDADLSHNPQDLPRLLEEATPNRIVLGSRYVKGGRIEGWSLYRRLVSQSANLLARLLADVPSRDSTTGYRCYGAEALRMLLPHLRGVGYELQVEALSVAHRLSIEIAEVPITFRERRGGRSKLGLIEMWGFLGTLLRLFVDSGEFGRALRFTIVGLSGLLLNEAVIWLLTEFVGLYYLISAAVSSEVAIVNNFLWNNYWTFSDRDGGGLLERFIRFNLTRLLGIALTLLLCLFTELLGLHYLVSNPLAIVIVFLFNYLLSFFWVWRQPLGGSGGAASI
jgi:dolichol-phosphate mannosyltransferase